MKWISVNNRLPKQPPDRTDEYGRTWFTTGERYLVYDGKIVFEAHYCFQNKCFWYKDSLHPLENITHWMPLPNAPEDTVQWSKQGDCPVTPEQFENIYNDDSEE